ncbi:MAG: DUF3870 domain-containing protein [Firmicutes bacterium]|nr:DUF3870 domain-containing protein [Bacillota bacterium]
MPNTSRPTLFFTGYAKLPSTITAYNLYKVVAVGMEIDPATSVILDADCTLATDLGRNFVATLLRGHNLATDVDLIVQKLERRYHGSARKALITAVRIIADHYRAYRENRPWEDPQL